MSLFGCASDEQYLNELQEDPSLFVEVDFVYSDHVNKTFVPRSHFDVDYITNVCKHDLSLVGFNVKNLKSEC